VSDQPRASSARAWLLSYFRRYKGLLILGTLCELISVVFGLFIPHFIGRAIDSLEQSGVTSQNIRQAALTILGATFVSGVFFFFQQRTMAHFARYIEHDLRLDFYAHLQKLPLEFFQSQRIGDLMSRTTSDLGVVRQLVRQGITHVERSLFRMLVVLPFMLAISIKLTLILIATMPIVSLVVKYFGRRIGARFEEIQTFFAEINARAQVNLTAVRVVRAYGQEQNEIAEFGRLNREYVASNLGLVRLAAVFRPLLALLIGTGFVVILWVGGREIVLGRMTLGDFVAFSLYFQQLIWPIQAIGYVTNIFQQGAVSIKRMHQVMLAQPVITDPPNVQTLPEIEGRIEFRDLTFRYAPDGPAVLKEINLLIEPGKVIGFTGRTGSGKSTLMNLVPRLLDAEPGMVLIDGRPIQELSLRQLRSSIGYVPQETLLFSETLAENIAFGLPHAADDEIKWAAEVAGLTEDIDDFPQGYQTVVGERGVMLSGGQKQRTALARAVIRRPKILILDDALSAVDTYTEDKVLAQLRSVMRERTTLVVSHRISTIKDADLICVLENGRIVMQGTHDELLRTDGEYSQLFERQRLQEELAAS
jgi:ATP-binding cassette, subfamily B, multidrug efflux pump